MVRKNIGRSKKKKKSLSNFNYLIIIINIIKDLLLLSNIALLLKNYLKLKVERF